MYFDFLGIYCDRTVVVQDAKVERVEDRIEKSLYVVSIHFNTLLTCVLNNIFYVASML